MTYKAPTTSLQSPMFPCCFHLFRTVASISSELHYLMLARSWRFGVNCCSISLTHHTAWIQACVPLTCGHVHRPPLLPKSLKRCKLTGLELRILTMSLKFLESVSDWSPPPNLGPPSGAPPPLLPHSTYIQMTINTSRRQDSV